MIKLGKLMADTRNKMLIETMRHMTGLVAAVMPVVLAGVYQ
jgi:hypothetical protein